MSQDSDDLYVINKVVLIKCISSDCSVLSPFFQRPHGVLFYEILPLSRKNQAAARDKMSIASRY